MSIASFARRASVPAALAVLGVAAVSAVPANSSAKPLPPGCHQGYKGEIATAFTGEPRTFQWNGYNAVPPGHKARDARVVWGDGKTSTPSISYKPTPGVKGCVTTTFTARHTYSHIRCQNPGASTCTQVFHVAVRYRDAKTGAAHAMTQLHAAVITKKH